jgi:hypothetical protein
MRLLAFSFAFGLLTACGTSASKDGPSAADAAPPPGDDAGPAADAATDAPLSYVTCADASTPGSLSCGTLSWAKSAVSAARPRNHHLTEIVQTSSGPYLYEMGGFNASGVFANVDAAPINPDGSLGAWASQAALPYALAGATGGVIGNVLVVAGGNTGLVIGDTSYSAVVGAGGAVTSWITGPTIGHSRMHAGSFVTGNTVYILGGFDGQTVWNDIVKATVSADGTISSWTNAGTLPSPLSHFNIAFQDNFVYIGGGLNMSAYDDPPALTAVYRGVLGADGTIGQWTSMPALPEALATQASFLYGGYVYVAGGIYISGDTADEVKKVWRSPIDATGALGSWEPVASLLVARGHVHQMPVYENHVYSLAGAININLNSTSELDIGTFQ